MHSNSISVSPAAQVRYGGRRFQNVPSFCETCRPVPQNPKQSTRLLIALFAWAILILAGCGTTTQKLATEQLLVSEAVDTAVSKIDFHPLSGQKVFLDTSYIKSVKGLGFVNSDYIVSSLRQQLAGARCRLQEKREDADIIVEPRVGALGTDAHEVTYGIPQTSALATAASALTSTNVGVPLPELSIGRSDSQSGIAKVVIFAFDRESREPIWQSGIAKAESSSKNTWLLGAGPFQRGTIYDGVKFAGTVIKQKPRRQQLETGQVHYTQEYTFPQIRQASRPTESLTDEKPDSSDGTVKRKP